MFSFAVITVLLLGAPSAEAACQPRKLSAAAVRLIKPLLAASSLRAMEEADQHLGAVLADRTPAGDEAIAYLLTLYLGEHTGEELVCEAVNRGKRIAPLIRRFAECQPVTGLEPLDPSLAGSGHLPGYALRDIDEGRRCEPLE